MASDELAALPPNALLRAMDPAEEKGSSTWLNTSQHGFTQHKSAFKDALALRYGWTPSKMLSSFACEKIFLLNTPILVLKVAFPPLNIMRSMISRPTYKLKSAMIEPEL